MNAILTLVVFYLGATRSFVSLALIKWFGKVPEELDCPLEANIVDDRLVRVSRIHQGCTLELFSERFSIDLVPNPLLESKVIVGMDC